MNVHSLQHVPFEGLGSIEGFLRSRGHTISATHLYRGEPPPPPGSFDWLIVMGGPMGVHDDTAFPWMGGEKVLIRRAVAEGKTVLGICLGAQMIADALGGRVFRNNYREIGWFPIRKTPEADGTILGKALPSEMEAFHWHGDTFEIPAGAVSLAGSEACRNQGFVFGDRVVGFQFHLETTPASAAALIEHCGDELDGSRYVQTAEEMTADPVRFERINEVMDSVLSCLGA